jgi:hypothetical protein
VHTVWRLRNITAYTRGLSAQASTNQKNRQCTYSVTLWRVRVSTVTMERTAMCSIHIVACSYQQCKCSVLPWKSQQCVLFVLLLICNVATNNLKCSVLPWKRQHRVLLLLVCNVATNNVKEFSAAMEMPTSGSIRIVACLQCSYQQCKSVQCCREKANNVFYSYCCWSAM